MQKQVGPAFQTATGYSVTGFSAGSKDLAAEIKVFVRDHHSAYAYPRKLEFVDELPKTLTGKIRRVELRGREFDAGG